MLKKREYKVVMMYSETSTYVQGRSHVKMIVDIFSISE